ncbi:MAG: outer membrane lipoprotein carrier protein LolA [Gammaproteobacteria bacterium]|nr:outer membrane lipoprotein carrier protein LolA [Gammaproteobacteria bacterium]
MGKIRIKRGVIKHQLLFFILFFLAATSSWAADKRENDKAVTEILQQLQTSNVLQGKFVQHRTLVGIPNALQSSGYFVFWRSHGLYWHLEKPFSHALTYTPDEILFWGEAEKTAQPGRQKSKIQQQTSRILLAIFGGDLSQVQDMFELTWRSTGSSWEIELQPKTYAAKKSIDKVLVKGSRHIDVLTIWAKEGDEMRILFSDVAAVARVPVSYCKYFPEPSSALCHAP